MKNFVLSKEIFEKDFAICPPYCTGALTLIRPRQGSRLHSTVRRPSTRTSAYADSFSMGVGMSIDWKRVLSDIPI